MLWSVEVGEGYAGPAVLEGRVYLLDYDQKKQADVVRCLSLADGKEIWRYSYPVKIKRFHGMSRTVPAVTDKYVVTLGPKGHVTCLDSKTGEFRWMLNLVKEYGTTIPQWYAAQCPLIDDGKAIIAPGGTVLMMAVDCETGKIVWQTPNPDKWVMTHSSIVPDGVQGQQVLRLLRRIDRGRRGSRRLGEGRASPVEDGRMEGADQRADAAGGRRRTGYF